METRCFFLGRISQNLHRPTATVEIISDTQEAVSWNYPNYA